MGYINILLSTYIGPHKHGNPESQTLSLLVLPCPRDSASELVNRGAVRVRMTLKYEVSKMAANTAPGRLISIYLPTVIIFLLFRYIWAFGYVF
jgi:hypothetical protein